MIRKSGDYSMDTISNMWREWELSHTIRDKKSVRYSRCILIIGFGIYISLRNLSRE